MGRSPRKASYKRLVSVAKISVIIPNYNRAHCLGLTVENMLTQTRPPDEVIVVDSGSTDSSIEVIRSFGKAILLIEADNGGPGAARNLGLQIASGEFIQFMDSDDLASRNKLEVQLSVLERSGADLAYGPWIRTEFRDRTIRFAGPVLQSVEAPSWKPLWEWALGNWCIILQTCLIRKAALDKVGSFNTEIWNSEDTEYFIRIMQAGARAIHTPESLVFYRTNSPDQLTTGGRAREKQAKDQTRFLEMLGEMLDGQFSNLHPHTQRALSHRLWRHSRYCHQNGWPVPAPANPLNGPWDNSSELQHRLIDYKERLTRKLLGVDPLLPAEKALKPRKHSSNEKSLALEAGLIPVSSLEQP